MIEIRHATAAADRPEDGIGADEWDAIHLAPVATQAEAEAGTAADKLMTPQRTAQAIAALGAVGPAGPEGPPGPKGDTGDTGPAGSDGQDFDPAIVTEIETARGDRGSLGARIDAISDFASPNVGAIIPGRYYDQALQATAATTVAGSAGRIEMSPFITSQRMRIDQIGVAVSTLLAGSLMRCFIYGADAQGWPGPLLFEGASDLSGEAAVLVAHSLDFTFDNGRKYWIGVRFNSNVTVRAINQTAMGNLGLQSAAAAAYNTQLRDTLTFTTPLPANWTFAEAQLASGNPPSIRMRAIAP